MTDEETILWLAVGAVVLIWLASTKKPNDPHSGERAPGSTPFGPGGTGNGTGTGTHETGTGTQWTPPFFPPSTGTGPGQPVCMDSAGNIVPMNADGSCPAGSNLTIAVDVTM